MGRHALQWIKPNAPDRHGVRGRALAPAGANDRRHQGLDPQVLLQGCGRLRQADEDLATDRGRHPGTGNLPPSDGSAGHQHRHAADQGRPRAPGAGGAESAPDHHRSFRERSGASPAALHQLHVGAGSQGDRRRHVRRPDARARARTSATARGDPTSSRAPWRARSSGTAESSSTPPR